MEKFRGLIAAKGRDEKESMVILKFLLAGAYNTAFSLVVFAGLYFLLAEHVHYTLIALVTHVISISNAFVVHRYIVFRSTGPILHEYLRSYVVYGVSFLLSFGTLIALVELFDIHPVLAQALTIVTTVIASYVGNSRFTFQR